MKDSNICCSARYEARTFSCWQLFKTVTVLPVTHHINFRYYLPAFAVTDIDPEMKITEDSNTQNKRNNTLVTDV